MKYDIFHYLKIFIKKENIKIQTEAIWAVSNLMVYNNVEGLDTILEDIEGWQLIVNMV